MRWFLPGNWDGSPFGRAGCPRPFVANLNSYDGRIKSAAAIIGAGTNNVISVFATDRTHIILDITGYFVAPGNPSALEYYPLPAICELVNTTKLPTPDGLGGPALQAGIARSFNVPLNSNCRIPPEAEAYSLNVMATPVNGVPLDYLTIWPSNEAQPSTANINSPKGTTVVNAAIIEAGNGAISLFASNADTHLQIGLDGYFAPPSAGPSLVSHGTMPGSALYVVTPCRGLDTRPYSFTNRLDYILQAQGGCRDGLPPLVQSIPSIEAYLLNATLVPQAGVAHFSVWPYGYRMPASPTIMAQDGAVTSNTAIVPTPRNGAISAFSSASTNLVYDVFGYFASSDLTILTQSPIPAATRHVSYPPFTMSARGGVPPYSWKASLPPGLRIDGNSGTIFGCPVGGHPEPPITVSVTDSVSTSAPAKHFDLTINRLPELTITTKSMPGATLNVPYNETLTATGGYGTYTWRLVSGNLPPGFSLSGDGVISGTSPAGRGWFNFTVQVTDQQCSAPPAPTQRLTIIIE